MPLMRQAHQTHNVIAPDTLGNGDSVAPSVPNPGLAYYADTMDRFCDAMGFETVDIYGQHTGAHIALEWAILNPDRVRNVVLDQLAILDQDLRAEFIQNYAPQKNPDPTGSQFHWAWNFMRDQMMFFPYYKRDAEHVRRGGTFDAKILHDLTLDVLNSLETYHLAYGAVFNHGLSDRLPLLTQNTLVITADAADKALTPILEGMPDVKVGVVASEGRPENLMETISRFIARMPNH